MVEILLISHVYLSYHLQILILMVLNLTWNFHFPYNYIKFNLFKIFYNKNKYYFKIFFFMNKERNANSETNFDVY